MKDLNTIYIIKSNGQKELFDADKINQKVMFACQDLKVSPSEIIMNARLKISDGAKSSDFQKALIQSAAELISEENTDYDIVAGRLYNQKLRKEVYGSYYPKDFYSCIVERVNKGFYDKEILEKYTKEELDYFGSKINYSLDEELSYIAVHQLYTKYLMKHNKKPIESPQEVFMLIPLYIFMNEEKQKRKEFVLNGYKFGSQRKISYPTPIMNGLRSNYKFFISCNLINMGDSIESIASGIKAIIKSTAGKSGVGINLSHVRGLGADVGKPSRVQHTGILPIMKTIEYATGALTQIGRNGASNINLPFYHYESELFSQLGDTKGTIEARTRHLDQTIILNNWFFEKALNKEDIYLFHMNEVPELYDVLGDKEKFNEIYENYSKNIKSKHKKKVNAWELLNLFIYERSITGRVYFVFADNAMKGPFKKPVYSTNLCCIEKSQLIDTINGLKRIDEITENDDVLSFNEKTNKFEYKKVLAKKYMGKKKIIKLKYNNKELLLTPDHKVYTKNRGWTEAQFLKENDELVESSLIGNIDKLVES